MSTLRPVPSGEAGELCLAGRMVGRGYRNNPELTASRFVTYHAAVGTGRCGSIAPVTGPACCEGGEIAFLGRLDDQVKIRGYRIELGEIVSCLDRYPGVEASAVVVRERRRRGGRPGRRWSRMSSSPTAGRTPAD